MTDNRPTELMKLLDERGEHYVHDGHCVTWRYYTDPHTATESMDGTLIVTGLTPEQAIAATLGSGTCNLKDTTSPTNDDYWNSAMCSECGAEFTCAIFGADMNAPDAFYCPNCGRKVVSA